MTQVDADRPAELRAALVRQLRAQAMITTDAVAAAVSAVPRERFMPDSTDLADAYAVDTSVVTRRDEHGRAISSVSAAYIQARMLEQAGLQPGMSVLEIGSGGLNAAYISEIVGPTGSVTSVDIDPEVTGRAMALLDATGYGNRVRVLVADAEHAIADEGPFDAIIVTVGAWDIATAWLEQLRPDGTIVVPLIMNGVTRTVGFRRDGDHLASTSMEVAGFVPMQGDGRHEDTMYLLPDPYGFHVRLSVDSSAPGDLAELEAVLATGRAEAWSHVTIGHGISFASLHLWLAWHLDGFCRVAAEEGTELAALQRGSWFPFGVVRGAGFAYLVVRPVADGTGVEFGAHAYGRDRHTAAEAMVQQIQAWNRHGRTSEPVFSYWPHGSDRTGIPDDATVMRKANGVVTISWPAGG
ncbi:methyltransferase, FxLD system [Hamadaea sp. NPDC051192]|uniref:methyltransferase, FxLD system n=1 Tax=Hamadaea sp. NPDC051192 TaxID=3154940 RepID=UPI003446770E